MKVILTIDHQWDRLGSKFLNNKETTLTVSDECDSKYLMLQIGPNDDDVFFVEKEELKKTLELF